MKTDWKKTKPKVPGKYLTRHARGGDKTVNVVIVTKRGTGLSVYCKAYNDTVPMSKIGAKELHWRRVPDGAICYINHTDSFST